ncbi:hypothetical protein PPTG_10935 [Phytophthora nicotianae INRA-310]|uniref:Uncharacterized protein n=1 Tax=Phytophthora nicotianae (strain INRA-310) TaxID=761204 RepID=W2QAS0_PHYN3|nr:hypothetical protein PPTG_10935 [Phytophthora nicotianae INRA-310]ETN10262.1 hypothetical protein PPTG_10935 [Phytophthora nicotianae INRA-310]
MKNCFQGSKSAKQLAAAWKMVATETFRLRELQVTPPQCKSKIYTLLKHLLKNLLKQCTAYRVALQDTGNATEKQLKEPLCYEAMRNMWVIETAWEPTRSSQATPPSQWVSSAEQSTLAGQDNEPIDDTLSAGGARERRWYTGKRARDKVETTEGLKAVGDDLHSIADALKVSRVQGNDNRTYDLLNSMREPSQSAQAQTQALDNLIQHLGANIGVGESTNN